MKIYNNYLEIEKDIDVGRLVIEDDVKFNCNVDMSIDIEAWNIYAENLSVKNINAETVIAEELIADNIDAIYIEAVSISAGKVICEGIDIKWS